MPKQGEIVLIPVPFTDLSTQKRRPVIVISNDSYNQTSADMIVVAMTSTPVVYAYSFTITSSDLTAGELNRLGTGRVDKIYTLHQSLVVKTFAQVTPQTLTRIQSLLRTLTAQQQKTSNQ